MGKKGCLLAISIILLLMACANVSIRNEVGSTYPAVPPEGTEADPVLPIILK